MKRQLGMVAAGHETTAEAAKITLEAGGNAFDGALAALLASCVAEPVLASLGGGGFLLAQGPQIPPLIVDFFAHTPRHKTPSDEIHLYPIMADFGSARQEFHVGMGSIATPGVPRALFQIHRDLCRLPLAVIAEPALNAAREGIRLNRFQHYISTIVEPILGSTPEARQLHAPENAPGRFARQGEVIRQPEMANGLEALIREGEGLFYQGEMAHRLVQDCRTGGGYLRAGDLEQYQVIRREPLIIDYHDAQLITNPEPALGGLLIAFTLTLLQSASLKGVGFGSEAHLRLLARAMGLTQRLRRERSLNGITAMANNKGMLDTHLVKRFSALMRHAYSCSRGTTQISITDAEGNFTSMTLSNGEGSGYVLPGTGIMMNNMLGEEDLNPLGFHAWPENRRIASMMAPSLLSTPGGRTVATGSGGSNRIRSAILQVLVNLVDFDMTLVEAVSRPRIHFESGLLNLEPHWEPDLLACLRDEFPNQKLWEDKNLFFGGAHSVMRDQNGHLSGIGDPRRGGVVRSAVAGPPQSRV